MKNYRVLTLTRYEESRLPGQKKIKTLSCMASQIVATPATTTAFNGRGYSPDCEITLLTQPLKEESASATSIVALQKVLKALAPKMSDMAMVTIYIDSRNVATILNKHGNRMHKLNWMDEQGEPVPNAVLWRALWKDYQCLLGKTTVKLTYIATKLNKGDLTIVTDALEEAHSATLAGSAGTVLESTGKGYGAVKGAKYNRLLQHNRIYFESSADASLGMYLCAEYQADEELAGSRASGTAYSAVILKEHESALTNVLEQHRKAMPESVAVISLHRDAILSSKWWPIYQANRTVLRPSKAVNVVGMLSSPDVLVTQTHQVPLLISKVVDSSKSLMKRLSDHQAGTSAPHIAVTDITEIIYVPTTNAKGVVKYKLSPDITAVDKYLLVEVETSRPDGTLFKAEVKLLLGLDIPNRSALNSFTDLSPKVEVLTRPNLGLSSCYEVVVTTDAGCGIYSMAYSNVIFN